MACGAECQESENGEANVAGLLASKGAIDRKDRKRKRQSEAMPPGQGQDDGDQGQPATASFKWMTPSFGRQPTTHFPRAQQ